MLELAVRYGSGDPVRIREIAKSHGIPSQFLVQILLQLKSASLVTSVRGAAGGYRLARDPAQISLCDILAVVESRFIDSVEPGRDRSATAQALFDAWQRVALVQREMLSQITLAELCERVRSRGEVGMYYI